MNIIELKGISKRFGKKRIFEGLDLSVAKGETLSVLGPSGSGKSVMLKLMIGLHKPDHGDIIVDGMDVVSMGERELREVRRKVAYLFQSGALFDSMDVGENVAYGLREHYPDWPEDKIEARVAECLEWVGLPKVAHMNPAELSGGMRKRVGLARAIAPGPEVILYDEPTTGLDPTNTRRISELIVKLKQQLGVTSVVITHDMECAFQVSDRIALLQNRRIGLMTDVETARQSPPPALEAFVQG